MAEEKVTVKSVSGIEKKMNKEKKEELVEIEITKGKHNKHSKEGERHFVGKKHAEELVKLGRAKLVK